MLLIITLLAILTIIILLWETKLSKIQEVTKKAKHEDFEDASFESSGQWYGLCSKNAVTSVEDFRRIVQKDQILSSHFAAFDWRRARIGNLLKPISVYVSFRKKGRIFRKETPIILPKGDRYITDGNMFVRTYCCNDFVVAPRLPASGELSSLMIPENQEGIVSKPFSEIEDNPYSADTTDSLPLDMLSSAGQKQLNADSNTRLEKILMTELPSEISSDTETTELIDDILYFLPIPLNVPLYNTPFYFPPDDFTDSPPVSDPLNSTDLPPTSHTPNVYVPGDNPNKPDGGALPVPEPGTIIFTGMGVLTGWWIVRRIRHKGL